MKAYTQLQKAPEIFDPVTSAVLKALWFRPRVPPGKARRLNWLEGLLGHKRIVIRARAGFRFACDQTDWLQRNLLCNGIHEPEITQLLESEFQPSDVFYDIGANSGYFSLLAATLGVGSVIGFEPDPESCAVFRFNRRLNGWGKEQMTLKQVALSDRPGRAAFQRASDSGDGGFGQWPHRETVEEVTVDVETLDKCCRDQDLPLPTVIKLDVEGWEHPVFAGARDLLENHPPRLLIFETACGRDGTITDSRLPIILQQYGFSFTRVERPSGVIKATENYVARLN